MFYQLVHNSQLAQQQSPLSSKNQTPNPTIVRFMSPFQVSQLGQTCSLVPDVRQMLVSLCVCWGRRESVSSTQQSACGATVHALGRPGAGSRPAGCRPWVVVLGLGRTVVQQGRHVPSVRGESWAPSGRAWAPGRGAGPGVDGGPAGAARARWRGRGPGPMRRHAGAPP